MTRILTKLLNNISSSSDIKLDKKVKWVVETGNFLVDLTKEINDNKSDLSKLDSSVQLAKMYKITSELVESKTIFSKGAGVLFSWDEINKKYKELDEINASISELKKLNAINGYDEMYLSYAKLSAIADITSAFASIAQEVIDTDKLLNSNPSIKSTNKFLKGVQDYFVPFKKFIDEGVSFVQAEDLRLSHRKLLENRKIIEILSSNYRNYASDSYNLVSHYENNRDKSIRQGQLTASLGCTTQYNASHIGSAGCYFTTYIAADKPVQNEINKQRPDSIQVKNTYTNGTIVKAPLDIGLTWNQSTSLDLDSHTVTPNGEHVYFAQPGSLTQAPNTFLYRDSIPGTSRVGAEQTRISSFQEGEYRFYIYNYSDQGNVNPSGLPNSGAKVEIFQGGAPLTDIPNDPNTFDLSNPNLQKVGQPYPGQNTFNVPTGQSGNAWYVFKLNTRTGILYKVDRLGNINGSSNVPTFK